MNYHIGIYPKRTPEGYSKRKIRVSEGNDI